MRSITFFPAIALVSAAAFAPAQAKTFFSGSSTVLDLGSGNAWAPTLSADGLEIIFSSDRAGGQGGWDLWTATRTSIDKPFGTPINLKALNSAGSDFEPNLSADGLELYFVSSRSGGLGTTNVMVSTRIVAPLPWRAPKFLGGPINATGKAIDDPALTEDGLTIYYTVGVRDIYSATRTSKTAAWGSETAFAPANGLGASEHSPTPHANGNIMVFASNVSGGTGSADFYIVWLDSGTNRWSTPLELKELNKSSWDSNAFWHDLTGRIYWSDWANGSQPVVRCACYNVANVHAQWHVTKSLVPKPRSYWPTPTMFSLRSVWRFSSTVRLDFFDCRQVKTWFVGVALKPGTGFGIPGTVIGGLELDFVTMQLFSFPATPGLPFTVPIPVPQAGAFPAGTVFYWQGYGIEGNKIISTDVYESEVR